MSEVGKRLLEAAKDARDIARDVKHPRRDKDREAMHRRAQRAEGRLEAARFWLECIEKRAAETGDGYMRAIARYALTEVRKPARQKEAKNE